MTLSILAVDDSATMRSILEMTFAGEDVDVVTVQNSEAAKAQIATVQPDIAIIDNSLPATSSYDLCRALKQSQPNVRVLVLASEHHPYEESKGRSAGVDGHATKPFETQLFIEKVKALLGQSSHRPAPGPAPLSSPQIPAPAAAPAAPRFRQRTVMGTGPSAPLPPLPNPTSLQGQGAPVSPPPDLRFGTAATQERPASTPPPQPRTPSGLQSARSLAVPPSQAGLGLEQKLVGLGLNKDQIEAVLALSKEVIEQVVWEVVPDLAETLIKEEIRRLTAK